MESIFKDVNLSKVEVTYT